MNSLFPAERLTQAQALATLTLTNPFSPERVQLEKTVLGSAYIPVFDTWVITPQQQGFSPNLLPLAACAEELVLIAQQRLNSHCHASTSEWQTYGELVLYVLYYRVEEDFYQIVMGQNPQRQRMPFYKRFLQLWQDWVATTPLANNPHFSPEILFALLFQIRRAFHFIFRAILGTSKPATQLRISVWQSIFSHDMRRYWQALYKHMHEVPTLILGPSGTGKELVASAIGLARFLPFDSRQQSFVDDYETCFQPVHLAALPATLLESELFGHQKGAFTGAVHDRSGYLETQHDSQSVFLDEIGELPAEIQVKLLRVLQNRSFNRVGSTKPLHFYGKIISATHRHLAAAMQAGQFREDLYYRLCADQIRTPSLASQLADNPHELHHLVNLVSAKIVPTAIAEAVAQEALQWIEQHLTGYAWLGNMRELEQCVRSIVIHGSYHPAQRAQLNIKEQLSQAICRGELNHDQLLGRYYALVYTQTGSYEAAARHLDTDWRTVKARLDTDFLAKLQS